MITDAERLEEWRRWAVHVFQVPEHFGDNAMREAIAGEIERRLYQTLEAAHPHYAFMEMMK